MRFYICLRLTSKTLERLCNCGKFAVAHVSLMSSDLLFHLLPPFVLSSCIPAIFFVVVLTFSTGGWSRGIRLRKTVFGQWYVSSNPVFPSFCHFLHPIACPVLPNPRLLHFSLLTDGYGVEAGMCYSFCTTMPIVSQGL